MPELETTVKDDTESIVACVYPRSSPGTVSAGTEVWSTYIRVQRYESLSCELSSTNIPADTTVFIELSTFPDIPTSADDWFIEDSYLWDPACPNFKYENGYSNARYYRVRIVCGGGGDLTDLAWVIGAKHL